MNQRICDKCGKLLTPDSDERSIDIVLSGDWVVEVRIYEQVNRNATKEVCLDCLLDILEDGVTLA